MPTYRACLPIEFEATTLEDAIAIADLCKEAIQDTFVDGSVQVAKLALPVEAE